MNRKILSAILLMSLILSASCGSAPTDGAVTSEEQLTESTETEETTEARIEPDLPDTKWEGYQFRVLTKGETNVHWKSKDIAATEENGDVINDAVKNLSTEGMLMELHNVPYMDLSKPWYDQNANEQLSIEGKLFATAGDMILMDNEATLCVLFNKKLAEDYALEGFYEMVKNGKWTIDKMTEFSKLTAKDLDGDGTMGAKDQWGNIGEPLNTYALMVACDAIAVKKNKDDVPVFDVQNEHFYDAFTKAVTLNRDDKVTMFSENFKAADVWADIIDPAFTEGRVLFNTAGLVRVTVFRAMETNFGILPLPKYDESQKEYNSMVSIGCANSIAIPATADAERCGAVIEALSAEGYYTLTPAYYDIVLKTKNARDDASSEMLDIIFDNRIFDIAYMFDWGGIIGSINGLKTDGKISSTIDSKLKAAEKELEKTLTAYSELE